MVDMYMYIELCLGELTLDFPVHLLHNKEICNDCKNIVILLNIQVKLQVGGGKSQ